MSFYFNTNNNINPIDNLLQIFKRAESNKLIKPVETQKDLTQAKNSVFLELKTKLNSLLSIVKDLSTRGVNSRFQVKTAEVSDQTVLSVNVEPVATPANHTILIQQLAKEDLILSSKFSNDGMEISTAEGTGIKTIRITVNGVSTDVNITIGNEDTNKVILNKIASAINSADFDVKASVISDTASTSRLVIKSKHTGSQYAISLADIQGNLLANIGLDSNVISGRITAGDTTGGYLYNDINSLDAKLIVDGINIIRGSNKINDVIPGVTIELKKSQNPNDNPVTVAIKTGTARIKETIDSFVQIYNDLIKFINDKTKTTSDGTRSILSGDYVLLKLKADLRLIVSSPVSSGTLKFLSDIGIKINPDGTLKISDNSKLDKLISTNVSQVEELFNSSDGIAIKLKEFINPFVQIGGVIEQRINFGKEQIKRFDERIKSLNKIIEQRAEDLRKQFAQLQSLYTAFARQQAIAQQLMQMFLS
ncbi:MAG: flagellar filament capping protein FliD [Candidatus Kryptonium sp.]|nr:flagellar filament capping protein FliD [Candidatus Kryptonium sp.]MDW8108272.1 flagellar filament capping protein FliD [Candidatus Kryptonium sp.]